MELEYHSADEILVRYQHTPDYTYFHSFFGKVEFEKTATMTPVYLPE